MGVKRRFNSQEKTELYLRAGGRCQNCGAKLDATWHADHVEPFSFIPVTDIDNGQALCAKCNLTKGDSMTSQLQLRPFQAEGVAKAIRKIDTTDRTLVAIAAPGSGKTLMSQVALNELWKRQRIDAALILVPRLNLCSQYELDWKRDRALIGGETMGDLLHVPNTPPLLGRTPNQFGAVATYSALTFNPRAYLDIAKRYRLALVLDEAHQLGIDGESGAGTRSGELCEELARYAAFTIVMTGTEVRSDDNPILPSICKYTEPDNKNQIHLIADVETRYKDGVAAGYLRPFEYEMHDGGATREYIDHFEVVTLSEMDTAVSDVLEAEGYWHPMVDKTIQRLNQVKAEIDPSLCGLIGATNQRHAKKIVRYIEKNHPGTRALLAVSDEKRAQSNLRQFKRGGHDILVTVGMAHVGYDHKPIMVVCCLSPVRQYAWLFQFFARGLRMMDDIDPKRQYLRAIVPDDLGMYQFVEAMRQDSLRGLNLREKRWGPPVPKGPRGEENEYITIDGRMTKTRAIGLDPSADVDPDFYDRMRKAGVDELAPGVPVTNIRILFEKLMQGDNGTSTREIVRGEFSVETVNMTQMETVKRWRKQVNRKFMELDTEIAHSMGLERPQQPRGYVPEPGEYGYVATLCKHEFNGKGLPDCTNMDDIRDRLDWVENYYEQFFS